MPHEHTLTEYLFFILLTWRITVLATFDLGPGDILAKIRDKIGLSYNEASQRVGRNWIAKMLTCHFCTSLWIGWLVALAWTQDLSFIIVGIVLSAGSLIVNRIVPTL